MYLTPISAWWGGDSGRAEFARNALDEMNAMRRPFSGYIVKSTFINSPNPQVRIAGW